MTPLTSILTNHLRLFLAVLCAGALLSLLIVLTKAQADERVLENTIPEHLPIKVKIKKDKELSFKDMKNEKWVREFELEVKNTGDKPIYFLYLVLTFPEVNLHEGHRLVYPLVYGRTELGDIKTAATNEDIPINPGETYVFKIHPSQVLAWEKSVKDEGRPQPHKVVLYFQILSFGDRTGYGGDTGVPLPHPIRSPDVSGCREPKRWQEQSDVGWSFNSGLTSNSYEPAGFLPVNFLSTASPLDECCPAGDCEYTEFVTANVVITVRHKPDFRT